MCAHNPLFVQAVLKASHNSYSGGPRRSVRDQLDAGVRCLELDITHGSHRLAIGHGVTGYQVSRIGDNPITNRLRDWLTLIRRWADEPGHADHAPLIIILDVKNRLASRGNHVSLSVLGRLCRDIFAERLFTPPGAEPGWPRLDAMRGRVLLVLSGDRTTRKRYLRDTGREPAVAANGAGDVVEVHRAHNGNSLWYWSGDLRNGQPHWLWHDSYANGETPAVALNDRGHVVSLSRAVGSDNLWFRLGRLGPHGRIVWNRAHRVAQGRVPTVRFASTAGRTLVATYETPGGALLERRGVLKMTENKIAWDEPLPASVRPDSARATLSDGSGLHIRATNGILLWSRDDSPRRPLVYAPELFVEQQPGDDTWMTALGPRFAAAPAGRSGWARDRLDEGKLMRSWEFQLLHTTGPPVSLPATDTPHDQWYLAYAKSRKARQ